MNQVTRIASQLRSKVAGRVYLPDESPYAAAISIWARSDRTPQLVAACANTTDVQTVVRAARDACAPQKSCPRWLLQAELNAVAR